MFKVNKKYMLAVTLCWLQGTVVAAEQPQKRRLSLHAFAHLEVVQSTVRQLQDLVWESKHTLDTMKKQRSTQFQIQAEERKLQGYLYNLARARQDAAAETLRLGIMHQGIVEQLTRSSFERLLANDERAITKKVLHILGPNLPAPGKYTTLAITSATPGRSYNITVTNFAVHGIKDRVLLIKLPCIIQSHGTCGTHSIVNAEILSELLPETHDSWKKDYTALQELLEKLNESVAQKTIDEKLGLLRDIREAQGKDFDNGSSMTADESELLFELRDNNYIVTESLLTPKGACFLPRAIGDKLDDTDVDETELFKSQQTLENKFFCNGYYASLKTSIWAEEAAHAVASRVERLLDGTIGIIYANSGADYTDVPGYRPGQAARFAKNGYFANLAKAFSLYGLDIESLLETFS